MRVTGANDDEEVEKSVVTDLSAASSDKEESDYDIDTGVVTHTITSGDAPVEDAFAKDVDFAKSLSGVSSGKRRSITAMQKRMEGINDAGSKRIETDIITGYNAFEVVLPPYNQDYLAKLFELSSPHAAAINAKVANIVGLGYDFMITYPYQKKLDAIEDKDKTKKLQAKISDAKHAVIELLDSLNEEDTFQETLQNVWKDYEATGNGYLEIGREPTTGNIGYIGHIPCTTLRVRRQRDGFVQIISNKAVFFRNFGDDAVDPIGHDTSPNEIIHIKKYSPTSTFYGVPDIVSAMSAVAGNDFSAKFNLDYFENKAVPRHVIILKGATINPRLAKNILEFFETNLKGKNHRSLFIPLPGDTPDKKVSLEIKPVEAGIQDASFNNYRKANQAEILMAHRVPVSKVSLAEGVSLASAKDADKTFKEQVCQPEQKIFEKKLNRIIKELTDIFVLKLNELALTDENTQANIDTMRRKTGTETANEQRTRRGLPSHPDGDDLNNMIPVPNMDDAGPVPAAGATQAAKPAGGTDTARRARDTARAGTKTDTNGGARNPKGEGRTNTAG